MTIRLLRTSLTLAGLTVALAAGALVPSAAFAQGPRGTVVTPQRDTAKPTAATPGTAATAGPAWNEQEYRLGAGDKLRIEVYGQQQLSQSLQVRPDGKITLPLIGDMHATGRTSIELRDTLTSALKEYVNNPVVTVIVQEATSAQIFVIGEVTSPGTQVLTGPMTVLQALAQAGGFKEFADKGDIRILRRIGATTHTIDFDYKAAVKGKTEPFYLQPGDTVVVP
jgi:polysaccharide biosynthesis/export protein